MQGDDCFLYTCLIKIIVSKHRSLYDVIGVSLVSLASEPISQEAKLNTEEYSTDHTRSGGSGIEVVWSKCQEASRHDGERTENWLCGFLYCSWDVSGVSSASLWTSQVQLQTGHLSHKRTQSGKF